MVFIKGKRYRHPGNCNIEFEVLEILFQCESYADIKVRWEMKSYDGSSQYQVKTMEENLRILDSEFDKWLDIFH